MNYSRFSNIEQSIQCTPDNLIDFESAKKQIASFLLVENTVFTKEELIDLIPAIYSYCYNYYSKDNALHNVTYFLHSKSYNDNNDTHAWAYGNNIGINLGGSDLMKQIYPTYGRVSIINDLFHEHRHVADHYDEDLKKSIGNNSKSDLSQHAFDLLQKFADKVISNNYSNENFDGDELKDEIKNYAIAKYFLAPNEVRARTIATFNSNEILNYIKDNAENLNADIDQIDLISDNIKQIDTRQSSAFAYYYGNNYNTLSSSSLEKFKVFQDELWKTSANPKLRPMLDVTDSMSRFNCRFYDKQLLEDYQNKIASLSISYNEERAREVFNEVTSLLNEDSPDHYQFAEPQLLYDLTHYTFFTPSKEDFVSIIQSYRNSQLRSLEEFLESFTDYKTDDLLECYAKAAPGYFDYYQHYGYDSNFIPLSESKKEYFLELLEKESNLFEESEIEQEKTEEQSQEDCDSDSIQEYNSNQDEDQSSDSDNQSSSNYGDYDDYGNYYGYGQD